MEQVGVPEPSGWEDPITGLEGPDFWRRVLVTEVARAAKYQRPLSVVIIELQGVGELAEEFGDPVARHVVREAGQVLRRATRQSDYCARIGIGRFGVVLSETDEITAINFVERVREAAPRAMPQGGPALRFSFGWASPLQGDSADQLVRRADLRLLAELRS